VAEGRDYTDLAIDEWARIHPQEDLGTLSLTLRLIRAGRILETQLDQVVSHHGFAAAGDYEVLATLRRSHPHPLQPAQLAESHMVTTSGMTGRLDRLERAGFIERRPHSHDRRAIEIHVTKQGLKTTDATFIARLRTETAGLTPVPNSVQRDLVDLLRILLLNLEVDVPEEAADQ
jgi:DNA-binding MarR family transcriptional regulator